MLPASPVMPRSDRIVSIDLRPPEFGRFCITVPGLSSSTVRWMMVRILRFIFREPCLSQTEPQHVYGLFDVEFNAAFVAMDTISLASTWDIIIKQLVQPSCFRLLIVSIPSLPGIRRSISTISGLSSIMLRYAVGRPRLRLLSSQSLEIIIFASTFLTPISSSTM